jgi:hypothetical protein
MQIRLVVSAALLAAPAVSQAQSMSPDTLFARAPWGAEAAVGGSGALSFLKLSPGGGAWLVSVSGTVQHVSNSSSFGSTTNSQSTEGGAVTLGIGRRQYRGAGALRPFVGGGLLGSFSGFGADHTVGVGGYLEMGASYFLTPRFSVGMGGALMVNHVRDRYTGPGSSTTESWIASVPAPTVRAAVFF